MSKDLVFTNSFNAAAIARGMEKVGRTVETTAPGKGLVPRAERGPQSGDTLFFTEERSLKAHYGDDRYHMWPRGGKLIVDDKLWLSAWLRDRRQRPVAFAAAGNTAASFPLVLKARHSWLGDRPLPRGWICHTPRELARAMRLLERQRLPVSAFFLQDYLESAAGYSTCGFFDLCDPRRNALLVTRRVLATDRGLGSSAIVEVVDDPGGLVPWTEDILADLQYSGPFELEFLRANDGQFYVLELNPRFWLQHGLFIDFFENVLLRRYVDENDATEFTGQHVGARPIAWLNTWYFLHSLLRGNLAACAAYASKLRQLRQGRILARWYPEPRQALRWLAGTPHRRITRAAGDLLRSFDDQQLRNAASAA
jgi:hypothetical protein